jgi:hypothetical protein
MQRILKKSYFGIAMSFILQAVIAFSSNTLFSLILVMIGSVWLTPGAYLTFSLFAVFMSTIIANVGGFMFGAHLLQLSIKDFYKSQKHLFLTVILGFVACLGFNYLGGIFSSLIALGLQHFNKIPVMPDFSLNGGILTQAMTLLFVVILAPITEEFALRGVVLQGLRPYGEKFAILISAFLFGIMHGNLLQAPAAFMMGMVLAYIAIQTESIVAPTLIHMLNNLLGMLEMIMVEKLPESTSSIVLAVVMQICLIGSLILVFYHWRNISDLDDETEYKGLRFKALCASLPMVLVILYYCIMLGVNLTPMS